MISQNMRPIGLTIGDPGGVGPELVVKVFHQRDKLRAPQLVAVGSPEILASAAANLGLTPEIVRWTPGDPLPAWTRDGVVIPVYATGPAPPGPPLGRPSALAGRHALDAIMACARLAMDGKIVAMVTAPVSKESLHLAGCPYPGHTDLLAKLSGTDDYAMMISAKGLHVVHVTVHLPFREICAALNEELILGRIKLAYRAAVRLVLPNPAVAVCGLNPHSGENGLLGKEEKEIISPAIARAQAAGIPCTGPYPADSIFTRARKGEFQMILVHYHDQGHIPMKLLGFMDGVNTTLGLPFIRTSVDHGTAYGKAGLGTADPGSLIAAVDMAGELAGSKD